MRFQRAKMYGLYFMCGVDCWLLGTYADAVMYGTRQIQPHQWVMTSFFLCFFFVMAEATRRKVD